MIDKGIRKPVTLIMDGQASSFTTLALTVGDLLEKESIDLSVGDLVSPDLGAWINAGDTISIQRATWMIIQVDGMEDSLLTSERIPANILAYSGIRLFPGDEVWVDGKSTSPDNPLPPGTAHSISVRRTQPIEISDGAQDATVLSGTVASTIYSAAPTLGKALWEAGFRLETQDRLNLSDTKSDYALPAETPLSGPLTVIIQEAHPLIINLAGQILQARSSAPTVGEALQDAGIPLQGLDYSIPASSAPLPNTGEIRLFKVQERFELEAEPLPFETETQPVPDLEIDHQNVVQPGMYGVQARRVRLRYVDGKEVSRQIEAEYIAQDPAPQILGYGTKIVQHSMSTPDGNITYWRALNMYAVSYNPTSAGDNITATGAVLQRGIVAIDPDYIPYGTQMYIPGYGFAVAADTGGGVVGRLIDLGYTDEDYVSWHQWVTVYFLWPPPAFVAWVIP